MTKDTEIYVTQEINGETVYLNECVKNNMQNAIKAYYEAKMPLRKPSIKVNQPVLNSVEMASETLKYLIK